MAIQYLSQIALWLRLLVAAGYLILAVRLLYSRSVHKYPLFVCYCLAMVVDLIWDPKTIPRLLLIEPTLLSLRFCSVLEAATSATELLEFRSTQIRRHFILFGIAMAFPALCISSMLFEGTTEMAWYHSIRLSLHAAIAMTCFATMLVYILNRSGLDRRVLPHYVLLTVYLVGRVVAQLLGSPTTDWEQYYTGRIAFLAFSGTCVAVWIKLTLCQKASPIV